MAEKEFIDQSVDVLNLNLFKVKKGGPIFSDLGLTVMQLVGLEYCGRILHLAIIGESHFLLAEGLFLELLACTEIGQNLPLGLELIKQARGHDLAGFKYDLRIGGLRYSSGIRFEKYGAGESAKLPNQGRELIFLEEEFPYFCQGEKLHCWTQVRLAEIAPNQLRLNTSHAYPPDQIVLTESHFVLD